MPAEGRRLRSNGLSEETSSVLRDGGNDGNKIGENSGDSFGLHSQYQNICKAYSEAQTSSDVLVKNFKEEIKHWSNFEMDLAKFAAKCFTETDVINCLRNFKQFTENYLAKEQNAALYDRMRDPKDMQKALTEFAISLEEFYTNTCPNITTNIDLMLNNEQIAYNFISFNYTKILDVLIGGSQSYHLASFRVKNSAIEIPNALQISSIVSTESCVLRYRGFARVLYGIPLSLEN